MKTITVKVQPDHLERLASAKNPIAAITELIWNSLDADAKDIRVHVDRNDLGGVDSIRIIDDGHGIPYKDVEPAFENLGGSWKPKQRKTKGGRLLHGKLGKGRFRAFSLGNHVKWLTRFKSNGNIYEYTIEGYRSNISKFKVSNQKESSTKETGTFVEITDVKEDLPSIDGTRADQSLVESFALYLQQYPSVHIYFDGVHIDPSKAEISIADYQLENITTESRREVKAGVTARIMSKM